MQNFIRGYILYLKKFRFPNICCFCHLPFMTLAFANPKILRERGLILTVYWRRINGNLDICFFKD